MPEGIEEPDDLITILQSEEFIQNFTAVRDSVSPVPSTDPTEVIMVLSF